MAPSRCCRTKNLVGHAAERGQAREQGPQQDGPAPKPYLMDGIIFIWYSTKSVRAQSGVEVPAVDRGRDQHGPADPPVQPVEPLVARPHEEADDAALGREQVQEGHLGNGDPGVAVADALPEEDVLDDDAVGGHHVDDDDPVDQQGDERPSGGGVNHENPRRGMWSQGALASRTTAVRVAHICRNWLPGFVGHSTELAALVRSPSGSVSAGQAREDCSAGYGPLLRLVLTARITMKGAHEANHRVPVAAGQVSVDGREHGPTPCPSPGSS